MNDAETRSEWVNSAQLHQPSPFFHAPPWKHQIEDLGKEGRIILKCNLKYNGRASAGVLAYVRLRRRDPVNRALRRGWVNDQ